MIFNQLYLVFGTHSKLLVFGIHHTTGIQSVLYLVFGIHSKLLVFGIQCLFKFIWNLGKLSTLKPWRLQYTKLVLPAFTLRVSVPDKKPERCTFTRRDARGTAWDPEEAEEVGRKFANCSFHRANHQRQEEDPWDEDADPCRNQSWQRHPRVLWRRGRVPGFCKVLPSLPAPSDGSCSSPPWAGAQTGTQLWYHYVWLSVCDICGLQANFKKN